MTKENKNLSIWEFVEKTDPKHTKEFQRGGGFRGTAVNPTYLIKKATELWGAIGKGWGYTIVDEKYVDGSPVIVEGNIICKEVIHVIRLELWFKEGEEKIICPHQFGQTTFVGKNKYGPFTDEEAPKKSVTDALTKCLASLGFAADIHMGMYDDNKYVNDLKEQYKNGTEKKKPETSLPSPADLFKEISNCTEVKELGIIANKYKVALNRLKQEDLSSFQNIQNKLTDRKIELMNLQNINLQAPLPPPVPNNGVQFNDEIPF